ncbi:MAG TPA: hypothetical protein PKN48_09775 [Bacteroidales bacterium]|nr:hypothetical protein [Bacteroidales bacterium]
MKTFQLKFVALLLVFITCAGFISWNREEEARYLNNRTAIFADKCFANFMKGMNELGAIYYIPDTKLEKGKELGLLPKEKSANQTEAFDMFLSFDQVSPVMLPNDECARKVQLTLEDLGMVIFVDKNKSRQYSKYGVQKTEFKFTGLKFKVEGKLMPADKMFIKLSNNTTVVMRPMAWSWGE